MPGAGQQNENDNSMAPLWIILGIFIAGGMIWYFFKDYIIAFIFDIRWYEADIISLFVPSMWAQHLSLTKEFLQSAKQVHYEGVSFDDLITVSNAIGYYLGAF